MASFRQRHLVLQIVATDNSFELAATAAGRVWRGKCIHCNSVLTVSERGELLGAATIEHIVPRGHGGDNALTNVGLACARCNHRKGSRIDSLRKDDGRRLELEAKLLAKRLSRFRELDGPTPS